MIIKKVKLEFVENTSKKFYIIHIVKVSFTSPCQVCAIYGRIGGKGTLSNKGTFLTFKEAETAFMELFEAKTKKGYKVVADNDTTAIPVAPKTAKNLSAHEMNLFTRIGQSNAYSGLITLH